MYFSLELLPQGFRETTIDSPVSCTYSKKLDRISATLVHKVVATVQQKLTVSYPRIMAILCVVSEFHRVHLYMVLDSNNFSLHASAILCNPNQDKAV